MKRTVTLLLFLLLCLSLLPLSALADKEVTILPTLAPDIAISVQTDVYAVDLSGYYGNEPQDTGDQSMQHPSLTAAEKARVPGIQARYDAGERTAASVFNKEKDVVVGVYSLDPGEYQGENVHVLLPNHELSDEELLELIDAYAQLGLTFDAEGLSWRNCMRGGGIECNRTYAGDERERTDTLTDLYKRQGLRPEQPFTAIPGDDGIGQILLREEAYSGLTEYRLRPCRRMTDEELLRLIQNSIGEAIPDTAQYSQYERQTREQLAAICNAPLALKLTYESVDIASASNIYNDDREVYYSLLMPSSTESDALQYSVFLDTNTGLIYTVFVSREQYDALAYSDLRCDPFDEKWLAIGREAVSAMRTDGMGIASVESFGESNLQYGGYCVMIHVTMEDGSAYDLRIPFQTERVFDFNYRQVPETLKQSAPVNN